jgi:hypothetical protein
VLSSPRELGLFHEVVADRDSFIWATRAYDKLLEAATSLPIADAPEKQEAWLLSLNGQWLSCIAEPVPDGLLLSKAARGIDGGMSGSPILNSDGEAIGVLVCSGGIGSLHTEGGPNPRLAHHVPGWLLPQVSDERTCLN